MRRSSSRLARLAGVAWLLASLILALGAAFARSAPVAHAAGGCGSGCVHWDSSMIYAGQNNGFPEGPVGEHANISGEGFTMSGVLGGSVRLRLVQGDVNNPSGGESSYEFCKLNTTRVDIGTTQVDLSGTFYYKFDWPSAASSGQWSVCVYNTVDGLPTGNIDDGPFTVMSSHAPSISPSATTVPPGGSITVTGQHWLPAQDKIFVYIAACADCGGVQVAYAFATSASDGSFSVKVPVPGNAPLGKFILSAHNELGALDIGGSGPKMTVGYLPTPTPKPTATTAPTATSAATATGTGSGANGGGSNSGAGGDNTLLIVLLVAMALLLVIIAGLIGFVIARGRNNNPRGPSGGGGSGVPQGNFPAPPSPNTPVDPFGRPLTPSGGYPGYPPQQQQMSGPYDQTIAGQFNAPYPPPMPPARTNPPGAGGWDSGATTPSGG